MPSLNMLRSLLLALIVKFKSHPSLSRPPHSSVIVPPTTRRNAAAPTETKISLFIRAVCLSWCHVDLSVWVEKKKTSANPTTRHKQVQVSTGAAKSNRALGSSSLVGRPSFNPIQCACNPIDSLGALRPKIMTKPEQHLFTSSRTGETYTLAEPEKVSAGLNESLVS